MSKLIKTLIALFTASVTIFLSIKFTFQWFVYAGYSDTIAFLLSSAMIVFTIFVFEVGVELLRRTPQDKTIRIRNIFTRKSKSINITGLYSAAYKISGIGCMILWSALASFSMITTITGQYNQAVESEATQEAPVIQDYTDQIEYIESQIKEIDTEISEIKSIRPVSIEDSAEYRSVVKYNNDRIDKLRDSRASLLSDLSELRLKQTESDTTEKSVKKGTVYDYFSVVVSRIAKRDIQPVIVQFFLSVFPAIFIDIIAPISTAAFLSGIDVIGAFFVSIPGKIKAFFVRAPVQLIEEKPKRKRKRSIDTNKNTDIISSGAYKIFEETGIPDDSDNVPILF